MLQNSWWPGSEIWKVYTFLNKDKSSKILRVKRKSFGETQVNTRGENSSNLC